jgi:hypothetical protein
MLANYRVASQLLASRMVLLALKDKTVMNLLNEPKASTHSLGDQPKLLNMDRRFGTWNVRS